MEEEKRTSLRVGSSDFISLNPLKTDFYFSSVSDVLMIESTPVIVPAFSVMMTESPVMMTATSVVTKNITTIKYNYLNLPTMINFLSGDFIEYKYNAGGQKISKFVSSVNTNNTVKLVEYLDGFQYTGEELNFFPHAEGYVNVTLGTTGNRIFNYVYNYTDHLGNIRLSYTKDVVNNQLKILEENNYYPFGLKHQKYSSAGSIGLKAIDEVTARPASLTSTPFNYKFNGVEFQDELGLNMYDMDMRQYDPAIARWVVLDPVIHHSMSPYNSFDNNTVFWADPSGADSVFDMDGVSASSITVMGSGTQISAGGASSKSNSAGGSSQTSDKSQIGSVSAEWTPDDESQFPGDDSIPGAEELSPAGIVKGDDSANDSAMMGAVNEAQGRISSRNNGNGGSSFDRTNWAIGTYDALIHNHKTYTTTAGIVKDIYKTNGKPRSARAAKFAGASRFVKGLGVAGFIAGTVMDGNKWRNGEISGAKFGLNFGMGAIGFTGVGAPASILYGTVEAVHPQGWEGYANDYQSLQTENAAINPGFITAPYGSQKF